MDSDRSKQILDHTFRHLDQVLEEMKREKKQKERGKKSSKPEHGRKKKEETEFTFF